MNKIKDVKQFKENKRMLLEGVNIVLDEFMEELHKLPQNKTTADLKLFIYNVVQNSEDTINNAYKHLITEEEEKRGVAYIAQNGHLHD